MNTTTLNTIEDQALESVAGGGIGSTIGGYVDSALSAVAELPGQAFGLFGGILSSLGDFISKIGKAF